MKKLFLVFSIFIASPHISYVGGNLNTVWASPIIGPCTSTLPRQSFRLASHLMYMDFNKKWDNVDSVWNPLGDSSYIAVLSLWKIAYGFENIFTVRMSAPINYQQQWTETSYGLGDIVIDMKYSIYSPRTRELTYAGKVYSEFSAIGGVRLPTGADKNTTLPLARWLGRGSTDAEIAGLVRIGNSIGAINAMIGYWGNGVLGEDRGDEVFYNFTVEGPHIFEKNYFLFLVELDGSKIGRSHYLLQVCPGIQFTITYGRGTEIERKVEHAVALEASWPIPIEAEGGYKYNFAPFIGVNWTF